METIDKTLKEFATKAENHKVGRKFQPLRDYCIDAIRDTAEIAGIIESVMEGTRTEEEASIFFNEFYTKKLVEMAMPCE